MQNRPATKPGQPDAYVFIVTYGRSGSTLLQNMLNGIPGYQIRGENNNALLHLARSWRAVAQSSQMRALHRSKRETDPTHPWFGAEKVNPHAYGQALANTFIRTVLRPGPGVRVSGFKEIRFHNHPESFRAYLNFIRQFFPQARFVFNTRNHDSVARSGWWADKEPDEVRRILEAAETLFTGYQKAFPDCCLAMHYDDYVGQPEAFRPLFEFLGEPYEAQMVEQVLGTRLDHLKTSGSG